jgi:hypothetical protein
MDVFNYIAESDPRSCMMIIDSFGYDINTDKKLGQSLSELVNAVGEPALKKILDVHPDKEIILELFSNPEHNEEKSCGCKSCTSRKNNNHDHYMNVTGPESVASPKESQSSTTLAHQTNVILVVSALFIATALILKKQ